MFRSPCGGHWRHRFCSLLAAATLSVVFNHLAAHSIPTLASFSHEHEQSEAQGEDTSIAERSLIPTVAAAEIHSLLRSFGVAAIALFVTLSLCVVAHLLVLLILVGPILHAYHEALET